MGDIHSLKTDYQEGDFVGDISASDLATIARFIKDFAGDGALIIYKTPDGSGSYGAVWMSANDFTIRASDNVVETNGFTGVDSIGNVYENGLLKAPA